MKKIKYNNDEGSLFLEELIIKTEHYFSGKGISKLGNGKMKAKIFLYFGLDLLFYFLMLFSTNATFFLVFYILFGLSVLLTAFNISHDAAHGVAVKSKFWNKLLFTLSFNLQGYNAYIWGKNHTESHHLYTNIEGSDLNIVKNPLIRLTRNQGLKWFHRFQYLYAPILYMLYSLDWYFTKDLLMIAGKNKLIEIPGREKVGLVLYKLLYLSFMVILPLVFTTVDWKLVLVAFMLNGAIVSLVFIGVMAVSHISDFTLRPEPGNGNKMALSWAKLQLLATIDYNPGSVLLNWTLGGFNAHTLHHLLPNVSHVHYVKLLPMFRELCKKHELPYMEMPYRKALASHFRYLKAIGTAYEIMPKTFKSKGN